MSPRQITDPNRTACDGFADTVHSLLEPLDAAPAHLDDCNRCGNRKCIRLAHLYAYVNRKRTEAVPCRTAEA